MASFRGSVLVCSLERGIVGTARTSMRCVEEEHAAIYSKRCIGRGVMVVPNVLERNTALLHHVSYRTGVQNRGNCRGCGRCAEGTFSRHRKIGEL